ncbi:MAG: NAD(P)/FAD-dependent oxidoreductase [Acidobacteriota bacterium]
MTIERTAAAVRLDRLTWDALVVGAGPAGSLLARRLAEGGLQVLLVDRYSFPRPKVCGGCLSARTLAHLYDLGHAAEIAESGAHPLQLLRLAGWCGAVDLDLPGGVALARATLDAMLVRAAIAAGADFLPAARADLGEADGDARTVFVRRGDGRVAARARVVVDATGLGGALLRADAGPVARASRRPRVGCSAIVHAADGTYPEGIVHMAVDDDGYVGAARLENGWLNFAAAIDQRAVRSHGAGGAAQRILRRAGGSCPADLGDAVWSGTPPLRQRPRRCASLRVIAVGDAAGYVEPFTGEGIGWALRSAELAAPLVIRAARRWSDEVADSWVRIHRQELLRDQRGCRAMAQILRRPLAARLALAVLRCRPRLAAPLVRRLHAPLPAGGGA